MQRRTYQIRTHLVHLLVDQINSGEIKVWGFDNEDMVFDPGQYFASQFDSWVRGLLKGMPPTEVAIYRFLNNGVVEDWMVSGQEVYVPLAAATSGAWDHCVKFEDFTFPLNALGSHTAAFEFSCLVLEGMGQKAANVVDYHIGTYRALVANGYTIVGDHPSEHMEWLRLGHQLKGRMQDNLLHARKDREK